MLNASKIAVLSAAFALIGAGCAPSAPANDLPIVPPAMVKDEGAMESDGKMMGETAPSKEGPMTHDDDDRMMPKDNKMMMEKNGEQQADGADMMMKAAFKPYYIAYSAEQAAKAVEEGRAVVYYFWAAWCPICQAEEPKIKSLVEQSDLPVAGFRVNYDAEAALKTKYKIPYQHTTVFLNARGEETGRFNGPVDQMEFLSALKKATR